MTAPPTAKMVTPVGPVLGSRLPILIAGNPPGGGVSCSTGMSFTDYSNATTACASQTDPRKSQHETMHVSYMRRRAIHKMINHVSRLVSSEASSLCVRSRQRSYLHAREASLLCLCHFGWMLLASYAGQAAQMAATKGNTSATTSSRSTRNSCCVKVLGWILGHTADDGGQSSDPDVGLRGKDVAAC